MDASRFEPDPDETADRTPAACPFCGQTGSFDGQGSFTRTVKVTRSGVEQTFRVLKDAMRCAECNGQFEMNRQAAEVDDE